MKKLLLITLSFICSSYSMQQKDFWTYEEKELLQNLVVNYSGPEYGKWIQVAEQIPGKNASQCQIKWNNCVNPNIKHSNWTHEEDQLLIYFVANYDGPERGKWSFIASQIQGRTRAQCRQRWIVSLDPNINHSMWTDEEDLLLIRKYKELGPKWAKIKDFFKNRTDSQLNIRYKIIMKKTKNLDINKNKDFLDWNDWEYLD